MTAPVVIRRGDIWGGLAAPVVPAVCAALGTRFSSETTVVGVVAETLLFYVPSLVVTTCLGGLAWAVLSRYRLVFVWTLVPAGFCLGALTSVLIRLGAEADLKGTLLFACEGAGAALVFCGFQKFVRETR